MEGRYHVEGVYFECVTNFPTARWRSPSAHQLWGSVLFMHKVTTKFNVVTDMGRGLVFGVSHDSIQNLLPIHTWSDLERLNSARKNVWDGRVFLSAMHPAPNGLDTRVSQFWGLSVFIPTPFDVERPNSAW